MTIQLRLTHQNDDNKRVTTMTVERDKSLICSESTWKQNDNEQKMIHWQAALNENANDTEAILFCFYTYSGEYATVYNMWR